MKTFIPASSIVRDIWGSTDMTLFIFAGASAEFALNKEVDWLYFTGRLPADPIGRLFSTVQYAQQIIFNKEKEAVEAIERINTIHQDVESMRGKRISAQGYLSVLHMLIYYSIASYETLERKLTITEKNEIVATFNEIGIRMRIDLKAASYCEWRDAYTKHLGSNLENSAYTKDLFKRYKRHLGLLRYFIHMEVTRILVSQQVNRLLGLGSPVILKTILPLYRWIRKYPINSVLIFSLVPKKFKSQIRLMNRHNSEKHRAVKFT